MADLIVKCKDKTIAVISTSLVAHVSDKEMWATLINEPITIEGDYPKDVANLLAALRFKVDASGQVPKLQQLPPV